MWQRNFWGVDEAEQAQMERKVANIESRAPVAINQLTSDWYKSSDSEIRSIVAEFIGLHWVRNRAMKQRFDELNESVLRSKRQELSESLGDEYESFVSWQRSSKVKAGVLIDSIRLAMTVIGSMHWTLVRFDRPLLATADHPVVVVPNVFPGNPAIVEAASRYGIFNALELRFNLDPQHCLLMTWRDGSDSSAPSAGEYREAANINRALYAQTTVELVHGRHYSAPLVAPPETLHSPIIPLCFIFLDGYGYGQVLRSVRRRMTNRNLDELIRGGRGSGATIVMADAA